MEDGSVRRGCGEPEPLVDRVVGRLERAVRPCGVPEPAALSADVDDGGVMQQPAEDGCCDDRIAEDRTPFARDHPQAPNEASP